MNLSDIFPLPVGTAITKQHMNLLFAAYLERRIKKFQYSTDFSEGESWITSTLDSEIQLALEAIITTSWNYVPYYDLILNDYQVNPTPARFVWLFSLADLADYNEHDVIFSIKDASLYFKEKGAWVKDTGQILIQANDKIFIRLFNAISNTLLSIDNDEFLLSDILKVNFEDALDFLYYLKHEVPSQFGTYPIQGQDLPDDTTGLTRFTQTCAGVTAFPVAKTFSPYLIYTDPTNSSIFSANNALTYVRRLTTLLSTTDINKNFMFTIRGTKAQNEALAPFLATDLFWDEFYPPGTGFIFYKESSYLTQRANLTAAFINSIYYMVKFYRYFTDFNWGGFSTSGANDTIITPLATYIRANSGTSGSGCSASTTIICSYGSGGTVSASTILGSSSATITTGNGIWRRTEARTFGTCIAGARIDIYLDMEAVLEIKS